MISVILQNKAFSKLTYTVTTALNNGELGQISTSWIIFLTDEKVTSYIIVKNKFKVLFRWKNYIFSLITFFWFTAANNLSTIQLLIPPFDKLRYVYGEMIIIIYHFYLWSRFSQNLILDIT